MRAWLPCFSLLALPGARARGLPSRRVTLIVPFSPGGAIAAQELTS